MVWSPPTLRTTAPSTGSTAAKAWHDTKKSAAPHRFAICCGSKAQLSDVCLFLEQWKVPYKPYSGDTRQDSKLVDLQDPDEAWIEFGRIPSTTSLSISVDPKAVQFARVFIWTHRMGCNVLTQFQAAMRYGRSDKAPLLNPTVDILLDCRPPNVDGMLVRAGGREATERPTFQDQLKRLHKRRGARMQYMQPIATCHKDHLSLIVNGAIATHEKRGDVMLVHRKSTCVS